MSVAWQHHRVVCLLALACALPACGSDGGSPPGMPALDAAGPARGDGASSPNSTGGSVGGGNGSGGTGGTSTGSGGSSGAAGGAGADAAAGADAPGSSGSGGAGSDAGASSPWPAVTDYGARGPHAVTREMNTGPGAAYDLFRPAQLDAGRKHPIISWANGTLYDIPQYQKLLEHWASHGFVVIAGQTNSTAGGATHKAGIDWLRAENARAGSAYLGKLDTSMVGAAGHSQGGGATIAAGSNKPGPTGIVATAPLMPLLRFEADATVVNRQQAPMLNINASMDDRDPMGMVANQIFAGVTTALVQASFGGIHEDAMNPAMFRPTLAWFRLHLMGDQAARALFQPAATCGLCQDPAWKQIRHKNLP